MSTFSSTASSDGKGDTHSAAKAGKSTKRTGPSYDTNSDAAMSDTDVISFQGDTYPGSDEGDPIALVNATADTAVDQKAKPTQDGPDSIFTKRARLKYNFNYKGYKPDWLPAKEDEIVYTDGIIIYMGYSPEGHRFPGLMAINSKGEKGFIWEHYVDFI